MNVMWRTFLVMFLARRRLRREGLLSPTAVGRITLTTLPTDIDILGHMNNGRYLSLFDLGRWDMMLRSGMFQAMNARGWYPVVSSETITFRKSLNLWQRFVLETRFLGHDDRAVYLEHRAVVNGEVYTRAIIRARFLKKSGGIVTHEELFGALGYPDDLPDVDPWVHDWAEASKLPSTKSEAPSVWN
ncbi:acyl-CoA thioesterase [Microbacterium sediminicola]|uniref:acyl-CoA thioesterase n=1 Tax=Microbacterium sediminicola TaxID=415210 RepID=UPI0031DD8743